MYLVCGLGNSGTAYAGTRHNAGYRVVDGFSARFRIQVNKRMSGCRVGMGDQLILVKPDTFMNLSGPPVARLMRRVGIAPENLIVVHDDLDMDVGRLKIRWNGRDGGHKGVRSLIEALGNAGFHRLKVGIGRDPAVPAEEYVLSPFAPGEKELVSDAIDRAVDALRVFIYEDKAKAMSLYNRA